MEDFVNGFLNCILGKISSEECATIKQELVLYIEDFNIERKHTEIIKKESYFPRFYEEYFVSKKIAGLSDKTLALYKLYLDDFFSSINKDISRIKKKIFFYIYSKHRK